MKRKKAGAIGILFFLFIFFLIVFVSYLAYLFLFSNGSEEKTIKASAIVVNPLDSIKSQNQILINRSNSSSQLNESNYNETKVIEQGVRAFDETYINYILFGLGIDNLHGAIGFGNPIIETVIDGEEWKSEIVGGTSNTQKGTGDEEDIRVILSKEEAVRSLLSEDIKIFMKNSVSKGNTKIEMVAGKVELFGKGYLQLYKDITGNEIN